MPYRYDDPAAIRFAANCEFFEVDGQMHGRCMIKLRDGRLVTIQTKPGHGVPLALLTHSLLMDQNEGDVSGFFSSAWNGIKKTAGSVATGKIAADLLKTSLKVAQSDLGQMALSFVPGGTTALKATQIGIKAANLIDQAVQGDKGAVNKIQSITISAKTGNPAAGAANQILKAVYAKGQLKGVYPSKDKAHVKQISQVIPAKRKRKALTIALPKPLRAARVLAKPKSPARVAAPAPSVYAPYPPMAYGAHGAYRHGLSTLMSRPVYGRVAIGAEPIPGYLPGDDDGRGPTAYLPGSDDQYGGQPQSYPAGPTYADPGGGYNPYGDSQQYDDSQQHDDSAQYDQPYPAAPYASVTRQPAYHKPVAIRRPAVVIRRPAARKSTRINIRKSKGAYRR
jgi:hypothetical protein